MKCKTVIEYKNAVAMGGLAYHKCNKKAKYKVNYISGMRSEAKEEFLCGTHFRAFEKNVSSINKKTGFDFQVKTEIL